MARYGGNTACVVVESEGHDPVILDAGTGLRYYGLALGNDPFRGTLLISHLHWDHVQGLPFFPQFLNPESETTVLGPPEADMSFREALDGLIQPPYFPVRITDLAGGFSVGNIFDETIEVGATRITARPVPHTGMTNGYRIDVADVSVAYVPDHQEPEDGSIDETVLELIDGVDVLIHDAQYTDELLAQRRTWGHCTAGYAARVAEAAGVSQLALFHHDPLHSDDDVDELFAKTQEAAPSVAIVAAAEGMKISL